MDHENVLDPRGNVRLETQKISSLLGLPIFRSSCEKIWGLMLPYRLLGGDGDGLQV
jgi:hypothetical protein